MLLNLQVISFVAAAQRAAFMEETKRRHKLCVKTEKKELYLNYSANFILANNESHKSTTTADEYSLQFYFPCKKSQIFPVYLMRFTFPAAYSFAVTEWRHCVIYCLRKQ